jgi:hypothetical protein
VSDVNQNQEKIVHVAVVAVVAVIFRGVWVKFSIVKTGQDHFGQNRFVKTPSYPWVGVK